MKGIIIDEGDERTREIEHMYARSGERIKGSFQARGEVVGDKEGGRSHGRGRVQTRIMHLIGTHTSFSNNHRNPNYPTN